LNGAVLVIEPDRGGLGTALAEHGYEVEREGDPAEARALVTVAPRPALRPLAELEPEEWLATFRAWTEEPFFAAQRFLRGVYERGRDGCWVAVTSILGTQPFPGGGAAGAASVALQTLVRVAAVEGGPHCVRANVVAPGWRQDALTRELDAELAVEDTPTRRLATQADVAAAVSWLLSAEAEHVSGAVLTVDGGYTVTRGSRPDPTKR
jgi:NAD(P)-dependent dehydrogenase (short-subunit alcohol dehydrogenase family)